MKAPFTPAPPVPVWCFNVKSDVIYRYAPNKKCIARGWIFTFDYIMEVKMRVIQHNSKEQKYFGPKLNMVNRTDHFVDKTEGKNKKVKKMHGTKWYMDQKTVDKYHLDQTYIGLSKIWTKNRGTKIIWTKIAREQIVCGLKEFGQKSFGQKCIGPSWPWTKMFWTNIIQDIILLAKFMLDKNTLDKPILDK